MRLHPRSGASAARDTRMLTYSPAWRRENIDVEAGSTYSSTTQDSYIWTFVTSTSRAAMASRSLGMRLNQGLRAQRAIRAVKANATKPGLIRSLATPVNHGSTTESTTLSNGFTVRGSNV